MREDDKVSRHLTCKQPVKGNTLRFRLNETEEWDDSDVAPDTQEEDRNMSLPDGYWLRIANRLRPFLKERAELVRACVFKDGGREV